MIYGIGTDILTISRIEKSLTKLGDAFAEKILGPAEWAHYLNLASKKQARYVAKQFAAKEALVKALGTGFSQGVGYKSFQILRDELGKPIARVSAELNSFLNQRGLAEARYYISISDEQDYVTAYAVIEY